MRRAEISALTVGALAAALLILAPSAHGGEVPPRPGDTVKWHVVEPGDTLEGLTKKHLGDPRLWRENWRLNPELEDPDLLHPGERIRIILDRQLPERSAEIEKIERRVEAKPHPDPWEPARVGEKLFERDGVRTYRRSSAELVFDDGTSVVMTEDSLLFVRAVGASVVRGRHESIEVVEGQADLAARTAADQSSSDIEVILGEARAAPKPGASGNARARLRRPGSGGAEVMVFDGSTVVEAAGQEVEVDAGMGTSVPEGGPPTAPESLLPAPSLQAPEAEKSFDYSNPIFRWQATAGARCYTVEVCADVGCGRLIERATALEDTFWQPDSLPVAELFWRVTAQADSGLDGYPAASRPLHITDERRDLMAPAVVLTADPPAVASDTRHLTVPPGARLGVRAIDDAAGVREISARWGEGDWFAVQDDTLQAPAAAGNHTLTLRAVDHIERSSDPVTIQLLVDDAGPTAPRLTAAAEGTGH